MMILRRSRRRTPPPSGETPDVPVQWRRLLGYLRPYTGGLALAFVALIISSLLSLIFPAVIQRVVDSVLVDGNLELLNQVTVLLLVVFLIRSLSTLVESYTLNYIGEKIVVDLRTELY